MKNSHDAVLQAIKAAGDHGATLDDLIHATGIEKVSVSPIPVHLERAGLIVRCGKRPGRRKVPQTIWFVTSTAPQ